MTLTCAAQYRFDAGAVTRAGYCTVARRPLAFSSLGGASATVTGAIAVGATLDDRTLVTGTLGTALHATYRPGGAPASENTAAQPPRRENHCRGRRRRTGRREDRRQARRAPLGKLWARTPARR